MNEQTKKIVLMEENPTQHISTHATHTSFTHVCWLNIFQLSW